MRDAVYNTLPGEIQLERVGVGPGEVQQHLQAGAVVQHARAPRVHAHHPRRHAHHPAHVRQELAPV